MLIVPNFYLGDSSKTMAKQMKGRYYVDDLVGIEAERNA